MEIKDLLMNNCVLVPVKFVHLFEIEGAIYLADLLQSINKSGRFNPYYFSEKELKKAEKVLTEKGVLEIEDYLGEETYNVNANVLEKLLKEE